VVWWPPLCVLLRQAKLNEAKQSSPNGKLIQILRDILWQWALLQAEAKFFCIARVSFELDYLDILSVAKSVPSRCRCQGWHRILGRWDHNLAIGNC
jgi:hypothetical protein